MTFTVKAEYAGITRRLTFPSFPTWDELHDQLRKVFRVDQYYLSNLTLGANTPGDSTRLLIGSEVRSGAQYKDHVFPFLTQHWRNGFLRFTVCDIKPHKESSPWNRRPPSQGPMDIDDEDTPREPPVPPKPWWFRSKDDGNEVPRTSRWAAPPQDAMNTGPNHHIPRWTVPHRSRGPGRIGSRALPTLPRVTVHRPSSTSSTSTTSTAKEEVHSLLSSFVTQLNDALTKYGITDTGITIRASPSVRGSAIPTPPSAPLLPIHKKNQAYASDIAKVDDTAPQAAVNGTHPGVWCNSCDEAVKGIRYKCTNCPNYDLCHRCVEERDAKAKHNVYHYFTEWHPNNNNKVNSRAPPAPQNSRQSRVAYRADCDVCGDKIYDVRHKCSECPDYDMCSSCYTNFRGAHRLEHKFDTYYDPADVPVVPKIAGGVSVTSGPLVDVSPPSSPPASTSTAVGSNYSELPVHAAFCDVCRLSIHGIRHKCLDCADYDMCNGCHSYLRHMHDATHTFVDIPKPARVVVHRVYDDGTQEDLEEQPSDERNNAAVVHNNTCDVCDKRIIGVRHKCLDCADYDMCNICMNTRRYEAHDDSHNFVQIGAPGKVIVHRVQEEPVPVLAPVPEAHPPTPDPVVTAPAPAVVATAPVTHNATCDMCDSRILGDRYKCTRCPDFDTCSSCFTITKEHHPHHSFVKVSRSDDIMTPYVEQFTTVHPAVCDVCHNHIIGIRFKCLHPDCLDVDLCQHCEALPIPVHPTSHPLVKFKHDYMRDALGYEHVFDFVQQTRLQSKYETSHPTPRPSIASPPTVPVNPIPSPSTTPVVEIMLPRTTNTEDIGEHYFPRVPTDEPYGLVASSTEVSTVVEPEMNPLSSMPSVALVGNHFEEAAASPVQPLVDNILQTASHPALKAIHVHSNEVPNGRMFPAGAEFVKTWLVRNSGELAWPETTKLEFIGGLRLGAGLDAPGIYHVGHVEPGAEIEVHAYHMKAPEVSGEYESQWSLTDGNGQMFGDELWCDVQVDTPTSDKSMSSSSIVMMPGSAPEEAERADTPDGLPAPHPEREASVSSPVTLTSSPPPSPTYSATTTISSVWSSPRALLRREISTEFVFVEDPLEGEGR